MQYITRLKSSHLSSLLSWLWILILCVSCVESSVRPSRAHRFPGATLAFKTKKSDPAIFRDLDWSDSTGLVLQGWDIASSRFSLYLADITKTGTVSPFFVEHKIVHGSKPVLSPSGAHLAFWDSELERVHILQLQNGPTTLTLLPKQFKGDIAWSPDGQELAFGSLQADARIEFYIVDLTGNLRQTVEVSDPRFSSYKYIEGIASSPDGERMAFSLSAERPRVKEGESKLQGDVFVASLRTSQVIQLTNTANWNDTSISWAPDSNRVVFVSTPTDHTAWVEGRLTFANADGSCTKRTLEPIGITASSWGPYEDQIALLHDGEVYLLDVNALGSDYTKRPLKCF